MKHIDTRHLSLLSLASLSSLIVSAAPHIEETLTIAPGWNAVYIESTPTNAPFAGTPVVSAAAYRSGADAATAQYDAIGGEIVQAPVVYLQWVRGNTGSTLETIVGGTTYLLFATNSATINVCGVPRPPRMTWRKVSSVETNEYFNLVGVSSGEATVSIDGYFGEGPFGLTKSGRSICTIGGLDAGSPELKNAGFILGRQQPIPSGKAYALTSTCAGEWPGVVGVQESDVYFGPDSNYASVRVLNCGTANHVFRFSLEPSATGEPPPPLSRRLPRVDAITAPGYTNVVMDSQWEVSLASDAFTDQVFMLDRSALAPGTEYGAILVVEDLGASRMRVRIPITVADAPADTVAYPTGLWVGQIALTQVSGIDDATPVAAGGTLKMNVMLHVDADGACTLLQRAALGVDTNGTARLFKEFSSVPAEVENPRRLSMVMMSVDTPVVAAGAGAKFGDAAGFSWTVDAKARDNPFRHAWHPDHDGKKADYSGDAPSGDDFGNYAQPVKPELWSISNRLDFSWHEDGIGAKPVNFPYNADETTSGVVTWEVTGLVSKGPIKSVGTFTLKRVFKAKNLE